MDTKSLTIISMIAAALFSVTSCGNSETDPDEGGASISPESEGASGFGTYISEDMYESNDAVIRIHLDESPYRDDLTDRADQHLNETRQDEPHQWAKVEVDNKSGSTPIELSMTTLKIVTDDGDTIVGDFQPSAILEFYVPEEDASEKSIKEGNDIDDELSDMEDEILPGTTRDMLLLLNEEVSSIKSVWMDGERLVKE